MPNTKEAFKTNLAVIVSVQIKEMSSVNVS